MKSMLTSLLLLIALLLAACSSQHLITGEPLVYGLNPNTGQILDRDTHNTQNTSLVTPHKGEIITLVLNNAFIRYLKEVDSPHVLVYAQVFDDGTDSLDTAVTKVLYNERNSPEGVNVGLADRVLYGPTPFKGFPLRIKLFIVELDKEQKALASKIIDAVGSTATTAKPEAAPAITVAVGIAKAINAMNEDDFELRFDMTLYPVSAIGKASTGDQSLDGNPPEPIQRYDKAVTMVLPMRTGSYVVMKRELEERFKQGNNPCGIEVSTLEMDYSQEFFTSQYSGIDGTPYHVDEVLRYEGGYFYRIAKRILNTKTKKDEPAIVVKLCAGPNRTVPFSLSRGIRQRFTDRTHVVLSVVTGLPLGLEPNALKAGSDRDARQITKLLDNPSDVSLSERIGAEVENIASSLTTVLEHRRISTAASRRVGRDPTFRSSIDYVIFWSRQIDPLNAGVGTIERRNAEAKNAAILESIADIVVNLPILSATDKTRMTKLRDLISTDLQKVADKPGVFQLTDQGKTKLQ